MVRNTNKIKKVMAIASGGGHWQQMTEIAPSFQDAETLFITTMPGLAERAGFSRYAVVPDFNLRTPARMAGAFFPILRQIWEFRPDVVISTGAAPGLMAIALGRAAGARTIWVDSIANAEQLSLSGKIAKKLAHVCFSQWEHVAVTQNIRYAGSVL